MSSKPPKKTSSFQDFFPLREDGSCGIPNRSEVVDQYVAGELSAEKRDRFDEHTFHCETCFEELSHREEVVEVLKKQSQSSLYTKRFIEFSKATKYAITAAIVIAILSTVIFRFVSKETSKAERDNLRQLYVVNSEPIPSLELNLGEVTRSSYALQILSPKIGENFKEDYTLFQWEIDFKGPLYLEILNKRVGKKRFDIPIGEKQLRLTNQLEPGMYYWKLENDEEALYIGKFFFKKPQD